MQKKKISKIIDLLFITVIIGIVVALSIPAYLAWRCDKRSTRCYNQLAKIFNAKTMYERDNNSTNGTVVSMEDIKHLLETPLKRCRDGGELSINPIGTWPSCSVHRPRK